MDGCSGGFSRPGNGCHGQRGSSDALFSQLPAELYRRGGRLASVCLSFLMLPYLTLQDKHVQITLLTQHPSEKVRWSLRILKQLVTLAFFAWMLYETIPWLKFAMKLNLKTEISRLPLLPWMAILPISFFLTGIASLLCLWKIRRSSHDSTSSG